MLTGSEAVRSFKRLVAALEQRDESEEDGPLALSALVDGAIVHLLDGAVDAPLRIAKRITRKQRASLRVVNAARAPAPYYDCVGGYQIALVTAYGQFRAARSNRLDILVEQGLHLPLCSWNGRFDPTNTSGNSSAAS